MILDDITLHNFGLYAGTQTFTLTPPSPDKPIVLIGGLNGCGKTTILDALQVCFFGPHAKISSRASLGYQEFLSRSIHQGNMASKAAIEIKFRRTIEGTEEHYKLHRSWRRGGKDCNEKFEVWKNGLLEPTLADNWVSQVEEFFPANIAHLFLFDGEQVEAYASQKNSSELICTAIQNLLGLDMVEQLEKDLLVYERRKRSEKNDDMSDSEINRVQDIVRDLRKSIDELKQERAALQTHRIDRKERALRDIEDKYRKLGGALYDQREKIERKWLDTKQAVEYGEVALRELAVGIMPLLLIRELVESVEARDQHEEKCRRARDLLEVMIERDREALEHLHIHSADTTAIKALKNFLANDQRKRQALGKEDTVLDITPEVRGDIHALLANELEDTHIRATQLLSQQQELEKEAMQAQIEYENIPDTDTIKHITEEQNLFKQEITELKTLHMAMGEEVKRIESELERNEQTLVRLIELDIKDKGTRDDRRRILKHSGKVRSTLSKFRRAVIDRHIRRIEHLVLESYKQLLRKSALVTSLSIDPESFSLTLFGRDNKALSTERLSAGERQLLAIALLWGLAKASGRPLPTAIDTPLSRLDSSHRIHLVERYLPFASHQVLILSTDEEIAGEYYERLNPWIGHTYKLSYDDYLNQTRIRSGYLEAEVA